MLFGPSWGLINLILAAAGIVLAAVMVSGAIRKRKIGYIVCDEKREKHRRVCLIAATTMGIAGVLLFMLTQDMSAAMVPVNIWTIAQAAVFAAEVAALKLSRTRSNDRDAEEMEMPSEVTAGK